MSWRRFDSKGDVVKASHDMAALVALYATENGLSLRSAQRARKGDTAAWREFVAVHAGRAVQQAANATHEGTLALLEVAQEKIPKMENFGSPQDLDTPHPDEPFAGLPDAELSLAQLMERDHWRMWRAASGAAHDAAKRHDPAATAAFSLSAYKLLQAFNMAHKARVQADIEARKLVPIDEFLIFQSDLTSVVKLVKNMPAELAHLLDPVNPHRAKTVLTDFFKERFNPQVEALIGAAA